MQKIFIYVVLVFLFARCAGEDKIPETSFYYWRTAFKLNAFEKEYTKGAKRIYLRYFDVELDKTSGKIAPVSEVKFTEALGSYSFVPVIYIKNEVFTSGKKEETDSLAKNISLLLNGINIYMKIEPEEIQFDCDWTESTKERFFNFLKDFKALSKKPLSATIRLHQVKYKKEMGIPPVDKGILMYYNMGEIRSGAGNSIYDKFTADNYTSHLKDYELPLDVALPIFSWGIQSRDGKVKTLLNKMNENHFKNDSNFVCTDNSVFTVKNSCFKGGFYFIKDDVIRIESVEPLQLLEMASDLGKNLATSPQRIVFYDLDSLNLTRYDKSLFSQIVDKLR